MPILPVSHFTWQCLRAVKRSKTPPIGRMLRLVPSRRTKDGAFLIEMVEQGLLTRVSGTEESPFDATYSLTPVGEHAAEFGECEMPIKPRTPETTKSVPPKRTKKGKGTAGRSH